MVYTLPQRRCWLVLSSYDFFGFRFMYFFTATEASDVYERHILDLRHLFWEYLSN